MGRVFSMMFKKMRQEKEVFQSRARDGSISVEMHRSVENAAISFLCIL
jgi:hypothetical protein